MTPIGAYITPLIGTYYTPYTGFCKLVVSCKMQMQSSLVSYSNNRVIRWVWNNANLIYLISGFSILHLQTDNQLAKHCNGAPVPKNY